MHNPDRRFGSWGAEPLEMSIYPESVDLNPAVVGVDRGRSGAQGT